MNESLLTCIDLANSDHQSVLSLKQAFEQSKNFFALPLEEKMKVFKNEKHRGYTPFYDQIPDPENQVQGDHKEGYYIGSEVPRDDPQWDYPFYGPNPWPDPDVLPGWRETMEKYHQEALRVCKAIAKLLALALDLDADYFDSPEMLGKPISTLRLLHYEGDHKEGYYIGSEVPRDDPQWDYPFYGPNPWPDPDVLPGWRETMEKYYQEALRVCKAIAKLLALALDLDADYFDSPEMLGKPISTLRLLHYEGDIYFKESFKELPEHSIYANLSMILILLRKIGSL
ncbi:hypothetical protein F2Q70_00013724 [Brassica cretica]|uniref:Non-haem dioxygenase N-terminal domain-containing protein n=1 Tax=Brassica cretica TaxID=69181 RepID=A0A8S9M166_BRACR|nr:hypothetical protein F2Q70_00013724 [Brassica cretica]